MGALDDTYGCLFLAVIFSTALWSIGCVQLWFYIKKYFATDKLWLRIYVVLLWILDTVYLALILRFTYIYFVREFGNIAFLDRLHKDVFQSAVLSPIISFLVQSLFVMRAWNLSNRNYFLMGGLAFLVMAQFIVAMIYIAKMGMFQHVEQIVTIAEYQLAMNIIVIVTFIADTLIVLVLICLLWKRRPGFKNAQVLIKRLIAFTIATRFVVGVTVILAFIFALTRPNSLAFTLLYFCIARMYYNCMLASLNVRSSLRENIHSTVVGGMRFRLNKIASEGIVPNRRGTTTSQSHREHYPRAIECRVGIDVESESETKKHDRDGPMTIPLEATNKAEVDSAV